MNKQPVCSFFYCRWAQFVLVASALVLFNSSFSKAADRYWSVSSGDWSSAANWGGTVPSGGDNVYISNGGTATIANSDKICSGLFLGGADSGSIKMTGGNLKVNSEYEIGFSTTGTFTQSGGTNTAIGNLYLGNFGGNGIYNLSDTGQLFAYKEEVGSGGTGTFNQSGGINSPTWFLGVGCLYDGTYNLSGTGQINCYAEAIGVYQATGIFNQTGGTNSVTDVYVGSDAGCNGTYNQSAGINNVSDKLWIAFHANSHGTYNLIGGTLILNSISQGAGTSTFNFGGGTLQAKGNLTSDLPMTLTGNGGNANVDTAGCTVTFSGALSGTGGLNKIGSGILTLNTGNTYTGPTTIGNGTLALSATGKITSSSIIDVQSNGLFDVSVKNGSGGFGLAGLQTLEGNGSVVGNIVATSGSHIAPGNSPGVLSLSGNLTLNSGSRLDYDLDSILTSDKIAMTGSTLFLNNQQFSDFSFTTTGNFGLGTYILIDAGGVQGHLGPNTSGMIGGWQASLAVSGNDLVLNVVPEPGTWLLLVTACIAISLAPTVLPVYSRI
jgi:autotransporter-associated beta strand protein